jgi:glycosyltransferase involved in cell wall biosynthesis
MKRVLHILNSLERSGLEIMLLSSATEWARWGFACDLLATSREIGPLAPQLRAAGYGVFHIPMRSRYRYLPRARFCSEFLHLCRSGYDVVHIHTETAVPLLFALAKTAGVRCLALTPHSTYWFTGLLRGRKILERRLVRLLGGRYGMISDGVMDCEKRNFGNAGVRTWNWLDTAHFRPPTDPERLAARQAVGCEPSRLVILSVGNCNSFKNHQELIRAIAILPPALDALHLHIGREPDDHAERALAAELCIAGRVRFLGTQENIREFLWAADAYVMPSVREGLSIAALEAIASGTTAVLSNVAGLAEIASQAQFTRLVAPEAKAIAAALIDVAATPHELRRNRALADSEIVRRKFSVANGIRSIVQGLYAPQPSGPLVAAERAAE